VSTVSQFPLTPALDLSDLARRASAAGGELVTDGMVAVLFRIEPEAAAAMVARVAAGEPEPVAVPQAVTPLQARKALLAAGMLAQVEAAVAVGPPEARLAWEYGLEVRRDSPLIAAMAAALGLDGTAVDQLFVAAGGA